MQQNHIYNPTRNSKIIIIIPLPPPPCDKFDVITGRFTEKALPSPTYKIVAKMAPGRPHEGANFTSGEQQLRRLLFWCPVAALSPLRGVSRAITSALSPKLVLGFSTGADWTFCWHSPSECWIHFHPHLEPGALTGAGSCSLFRSAGLELWIHIQHPNLGASPFHFTEARNLQNPCVAYHFMETGIYL